MGRVSLITTVRVVSSVGGALILLVLTLSTLLAAGQQPSQINHHQSSDTIFDNSSPLDQKITRPPALPPAQKSGITPTTNVPPLPDWAKALLEGNNDLQIAANEISISKLASHATTFDGEWITYTVVLTNNTPGAITDVTVLDVLPKNTQGNVQLDNVDTIPPCNSNPTCTNIVRSDPITIEQPGGSVITGPPGPATQIEWQIASLPPGRTELVFRGRVACQPAGATLKNRALFFFSLGGNSSNETSTQVVARPIPDTGQFLLSPEPVWCSSNVLGANDMDVGDMDGDGDMDIALGDPLQSGTRVYRNTGGQFSEAWNKSIFTYGLSWFDANNNGNLELLSVGNWDVDIGCCRGINYLYDKDGNEIDRFFSDNGFFRVAPADYNNDGNLDIASAIFWTADVGGIGCRVRLYENLGSPNYFNSYSQTNTICLVRNIAPDFPRARTVAWGDYDNNGFPDLAVGKTNGTINVFFNSGSAPYMASTNIITVDSTLFSEPYDIAWGDYDNDGYLDLAVVYPFAGFPNGQLRVYRNVNGSSWSMQSTSIPYGYARGLAWGDFNGDGTLDLAVGSTIYTHAGGGSFVSSGQQANTSFSNIYRVRGFDYDNDGDLDLGLANQSGVSGLFPAFSPRLATTPASIDSFAAHSVAWGNVDGDNDLDLIFGVAQGAGIDSRLYKNSQGVFSWNSNDKFTSFAGPGPHTVSVGDVDGDFDLDLAVGGSNGVQYYVNNAQFPTWSYSFPSANNGVVAWGDSDGDGDLDLLAGSNGTNYLFVNQGAGLDATPGWQSAETENTRSVAWGDYNNDFYLDFAAGNSGQPTRVYRNNKDNTFSVVWSSPHTWDTRSVAWGDYDQDGNLDLAVGNYDGPNYVYRNQGGSFSMNWTDAVSTNKTTSVAWGDWDNDSDVDLAVGNDGQADLVYNNLKKETGLTKLALSWQAANSIQTTGVAWGDKDNDGDLDLAFSRTGAGNNGVYENTYVMPSHLASVFTPTAPLPNNPTYISIVRPGTTKSGYFFSSAEVLTSATVGIDFTIFDPDGTRANVTNADGDDFISTQTIYEYSLNGGGSWQTATPSSSPSSNVARRQGAARTFVWDVTADNAVSDDARFRITVINHLGVINSSFPQNRSGLNQRASVSAVSPPFRVRPIVCSWPANVTINYDPANPGLNEIIRFDGETTKNIGGVGSLIFTWDFGDGSTPSDSTVSIQHVYTSTGIYSVTLRVTGDPCPVVPYEAVAMRTIAIGVSTGTLTGSIYLPIIQKGGVGTTGLETYNLSVTPDSPPQVTGLSGTTQPDQRITVLSWQPTTPAEAILGYRIYRQTAEETDYQRLADLPANSTFYTDDTASCGQMYFVTAYNNTGESLPSTSVYASQSCQRPSSIPIILEPAGEGD